MIIKHNAFLTASSRFIINAKLKRIWKETMIPGLHSWPSQLYNWQIIIRLLCNTKIHHSVKKWLSHYSVRHQLNPVPVQYLSATAVLLLCFPSSLLDSGSLSNEMRVLFAHVFYTPSPTIYPSFNRHNHTMRSVQITHINHRLLHSPLSSSNVLLPIRIPTFH
jgi:hypothetical protein